MEELQEIIGEGFQDSLHLVLRLESILKISNLNGSMIILYI